MKLNMQTNLNFKMNYLTHFLLLATLFFGFNSCQKKPGVGGDAKINGKVYFKHYNSTFSTLIEEGYLADTYVYIVYGDQLSYGTRLKTNYKGEFEFKYLYPGKYKVYTYSLDSLAMVNGQMPVNQKVIIDSCLITKRKEIISLSDLYVFK
ncbi:MAG: hypothetical protein RLZZ30_278 [Bacteroidota bacterium]|jgi:hypothetical protein